MNLTSTKGYSVPLRAIWLQNQDIIDVRVTVSGKPTAERILTMPVTAHINPSTGQLLGVVVLDSKALRLGRWLRANWEEVPVEEGEPVPAGVVIYDEGALFAYFSIWPNLSGEEPEHAERRRAEIHLDEEGDLKRIRLPVTVRRSEDALAVAAGYLPTR
ncbi:MAG: hypothetical protein KF893_19915 [Caldilineaceae bacterium]|nr:hypothetical protein [Caldilineaceae bacterium]